MSISVSEATGYFSKVHVKKVQDIVHFSTTGRGESTDINILANNLGWHDIKKSAVWDPIHKIANSLETLNWTLF